MIYDATETISDKQQRHKRLILKIVKRNDLNQHQCGAIPFEGRVVAEQLLNF